MNNRKRIILTSLFLAIVLTVPPLSNATQLPRTKSTDEIDLDPLTDITVTFQLQEIRAYDDIDLFSEADFYVKVTIDEQEFISDIWKNMNYVVNPGWTATANVPDYYEWVYITVELWDWNLGLDTLCDIGGHEEETNLFNSSTIELWYNTKTGMWTGEDYREPYYFNADPSGYGRLNGCDDNSIYQDDNDCELRFDITQPDPDGDGIPYWAEVNMYGTDPEVDNTGEDVDGDGCPIEWEHKWGVQYGYDWDTEEYVYWTWYHPYYYDEHDTLDPDSDGIENTEEYLTSQWGSDPYRQDIFLELDEMEPGPDGEGVFIPELSKTMLRDAYGKHNIMFFLDDYLEDEMTGGELYPFDEEVTGHEMQEIYWKYFMHQDVDNWRRGVFHYGLITYHHEWFHGFCWHSELELPDNTTSVRRDCIHIATKEHEVIPYNHTLLSLMARRSLNREYHQAIIYASAIMHETGHTLGIFHGNTPGCDDQQGKFPWQINWWKWLPYKSCMNYGWMYTIVDYSDGSRGRNDFDDWENIDLTAFQKELY